MDATYRTARGRYELYGIVVDVEGAGFPIAYIVIDTTKVENMNTSTGRRREILEQFLMAIKESGVKPDFVFTDKDFGEINAVTNVWGPLKVQLCLWHMERALNRKLVEKHKKSKNSNLISITYNAGQAADEFGFIDPTFYPTEYDRDPHNYVVCPITYHEQIVKLVRKHYSMHPLIPCKLGSI